jgi:hypothetical protein
MSEDIISTTAAKPAANDRRAPCPPPCPSRTATTAANIYNPQIGLELVLVSEPQSQKSSPYATGPPS